MGWLGATLGTRGVNAAVVSVLGAALYNRWTTTVHSLRDFGIALVGLSCLSFGAPPLVVVPSAAVGMAMAAFRLPCAQYTQISSCFKLVGQEL